MKIAASLLIFSAAFLFPSSAKADVFDPKPGMAGCDKRLVLNAEIKVAATICKPQNITESTVAVVLVQESSKEDRDWKSGMGKKFASELAMRGVVTLRFDMPGTGKSEKAPKEADNKFYGKIISEGASWINKRFGINKKKIFLLGHGKGAQYIVAASNHWRTLKWNYGGLIFVDTASDMVSVDELGRVREPAMVARGTRDGAVSSEEIAKIKKSLKNSKGTRLSNIEGMGHDLKLSDNSISYSLIIAVQQWAETWGNR